jgi:rhamnogalacturonan endolyase
MTKGDEVASKRAYATALEVARGPEERRLIEAARDGTQVADVKVVKGRACKLVSEGLKPGAKVYGDRDYTYVSVPDDLKGATYFTMANNDKGSSSKEYLVFTVSAPVNVYVGFDSRATQRPGWLRAWRDTKQSLRTTDSGCRLKLYAKSFPAGTVTLGGNKAPGAGSHYVVAIGK